MINIIKGILIAISLLVPGVSGGTMMIVLGVYDQSIEAISALISRKLVHTKLIIQLGIGGVIGIVLFAKVMSWALKAYPHIMSFFFLGIIIIGVYAIIKKVDWKNFKLYHILFLVGGVFVAYIMTSEQSTALFEFQGSFIQKFIMIIVAGIIIAVALILPGISTSFLLLTLGLYDTTLNAVENFDIGYLAPLGVGAVIGVLLTTKILEYCMKKHPTPTYLMILGFILGSIREIFPGWPTGLATQFSGIVAFILGAAVMVIIQVIMKKYPSAE